MPKPSVKETLAILQQALSAINSKSINWQTIAMALEGFSAALVVKVANDAAKVAVIDGKGILLEQHLLSAIQENKIFNKN